MCINSNISYEYYTQSYKRFLLGVKEEKLEETSVISDLSPTPTPPTMAQQQTQPTAGSGILDAVPLFVVILLAAHVLALVRFPLAFLLLFRPPAPTRYTLCRFDPAQIRTYHRFSLWLQVFWMYKLASEKQPPRRKTQ